MKRLNSQSGRREEKASHTTGSPKSLPDGDDLLAMGETSMLHFTQAGCMPIPNVFAALRVNLYRVSSSIRIS